MTTIDFKVQKGISSIIAGVIVVSLVATFLAHRTIQKTLDEYAEETAYSWGTYLAQNLLDLDTIAFGLAPSQRSLDILETSQQVGDIFRYKIFNAQGQLTLISDDLDYRYEEGSDRLMDHNPAAATLLDNHQAFIDVRQGDGETRPLHYSEAYVPLIVDGETIGLIEVYVDQTHFRANLLSSFSGLSTQLLIAMGLAFGVPAIWFLRRTREHEETQSELDHASHHDRLTGTRNRSRFNSDLDKMIESGSTVSIYTLDFDHFKAVNDTHGHHVGDEVLRQAGERLAKLVGDAGIIGRPSGDEFAICQPHAQRPTKTCSDFTQLIRQTLTEPYHINELTIECRCSIGYAASPKHGNDAAVLVQRATVALDQAKVDGRNRTVIYDESIEEARRERLNLEGRLREAVQADLFTLNYQPQFDTFSAELVGFEALARLNDEDGKPISPEKFVPVIEEIGLINHLGEWVLRNACGFAALWPDKVMVAVNLSAIQFEDGKLVDTVKSILQETNLPAERLELEITESLLIDDTDNVIRQLHELSALGIKIALDDFGTGYSSLSYLWKFPFDRLKIDRSFVQQIESTNGKAYDILHSIVSLARALNLEITAEGVETLKQVDVLRSMGASHVQGFLLGRPLPEVDVPALILSKAQPLVDASDPTEIAKRISLVS
ncbi:MAG: hypothetical protein Rhims3KO_16420 [Hyphomicrobiales bacterium]